MTREEYGRAYEKGFNITIRFLKSRHFTYDKACEIAQDAWGKGWEMIEQLKNPSQVSTWINSIALNIAYSELRKIKGISLKPLNGFENICEMNFPRLDTSKLLSYCGNKNRRAIILRYIFGCSQKEIANMEAISLSASKLRIYHAKKEIIDRLARRSARPRKK